MTGAAGPLAVAEVLSVSARAGHSFSKDARPVIELLAGLGVADDGHAGHTVQHRSRVARDASQPNLRQVHLLHAELLAELAAQGFAVAPGALGENITTRGIDLLGLPTGAVLHLGAQARVQITGLRNPCAQIEAFQPGLLAAVLVRRPDGQLLRKAGVMGVVLSGGPVRPGDPIVRAPGPAQALPLQPV
ncbi:MOSC domain-containing protein [Aquabacterium sp. OR-4]|uniref:MOSC domain-containing protein n=1 Tax=Aquabacterium sp. OR-4 TaxID=2978127 RepID=UPI0021B42B67|nr:MOSC domain-containing protein [Aquabacterium sp. OR-4]MDT7834388.1 MOSC domain-containing protein [Aquabacterium sp. OR-4]